jgi:hypothetical protein
MDMRNAVWDYAVCLRVIPNLKNKAPDCATPTLLNIDLISSH